MSTCYSAPLPPTRGRSHCLCCERPWGGHPQARWRVSSVASRGAGSISARLLESPSLPEVQAEQRSPTLSTDPPQTLLHTAPVPGAPRTLLQAPGTGALPLASAAHLPTHALHQAQSVLRKPRSQPRSTPKGRAASLMSKGATLSTWLVDQVGEPCSTQTDLLPDDATRLMHQKTCLSNSKTNLTAQQLRQTERHDRLKERLRRRTCVCGALRTAQQGNFRDLLTEQVSRHRLTYGVRNTHPGLPPSHPEKCTPTGGRCGPASGGEHPLGREQRPDTAVLGSTVSCSHQ